jgi:hypothetical protein
LRVVRLERIAQIVNGLHAMRRPRILQVESLRTGFLGTLFGEEKPDMVVVLLAFKRYEVKL